MVQDMYHQVIGTLCDEEFSSFFKRGEIKRLKFIYERPTVLE